MEIVRDCLGYEAAHLRDMFGRSQRVVTYATATEAGIVWSSSEEALFAEKVRLATRPGLYATQAKDARGLDIERFDATVADARPFCLERIEFCEIILDILPDALLYCAASTVPLLLPAVADFLQAGKATLDVAWWWDQGEPESIDPLIAELARLGAVVDPAWVTLWQFASPGNGLPEDAFWDEAVQNGTIAWSR
jgi:hypothetical protein